MTFVTVHTVGVRDMTARYGGWYENLYSIFYLYTLFCHGSCIFNFLY